MSEIGFKMQSPASQSINDELDLEDVKRKLLSNKNRSTVNSFAEKIIEAEQILDNLVDDYSNYRHSKKVKLLDLLSYSRKISYTTFAPPNYDLRGGALPPAPQEEQMRASLLHKYANLDVGLPKRDYGITIVEPLIETNPRAEMLPPNIVVPVGWKPGMPVELPSDMPILPPPGWKPGMPVELPSDMLILPPPGWKPGIPVELPSPPPGWKPGDPVTLPPLPPKAIQVRRVQLDIEDNDSDYTSGCSSSDSDV